MQSSLKSERLACFPHAASANALVRRVSRLCGERVAMWRGQTRPLSLSGLIIHTAASVFVSSDVSGVLTHHQTEPPPPAQLSFCNHIITRWRGVWLTVSCVMTVRVREFSLGDCTVTRTGRG